MSTDQETISKNTRLEVKSAPSAAVHLASKNPFAGQTSYYENRQDARRNKSAPLENKIFTNYCSVVDHDDLKNKGLHKSLGSLEKNYTRGVKQCESRDSGLRETSILGGSVDKHGKESSNGRPQSPTPSTGSYYSRQTDTSLKSSMSVPVEGSNGARPEEWTKQRVHENSMEWRAGYENWRTRAIQVYGHMDRELTESLAAYPLD